MRNEDVQGLYSSADVTTMIKSTERLRSIRNFHNFGCKTSRDEATRYTSENKPEDNIKVNEKGVV